MAVNKMNNEILLKIAIEASLKAGEAIMEVYDTDFDIQMKVDNSPLTEADRKANEVINSFLVQTEIPIISEESEQTDYSLRKKWDLCWVVDPIDGTKEFIKRNGEFTVNIALVKNNLTKLGVIYVPATKILYYADVDKNKAYKIELESHHTSIDYISKNQILLQPKKKGDKIIQVVGSRSHMNPETLKYCNTLRKGGNQVEMVSKGSSLKFCLIAEGKADIYPRFAPTMEWDTAAGQAICNAVGVNVISKQTNEALLYNKENLLNPFFLVSKY